MTDGPAVLMPRQKARLAAVQAIYQMDVAGIGVEAVIVEFCDHRFDRPAGEHQDSEPSDDLARLMDEVDIAHFKRIVRGVLAYQSDLDKGVDNALREGWPLKRLDTTVRSVLRAGALELLVCEDIPTPVILNEYVGLARSFFEGDEAPFINGVLDKVAKEWRGQTSHA